jgi:hypothetical protein
MKTTVITCKEFREKHKPDVKFAALTTAERGSLFAHWKKCDSCRFFIEMLRPDEQDQSFNGKLLADADVAEMLKRKES